VAEFSALGERRRRPSEGNPFDRPRDWGGRRGLCARSVAWICHRARPGARAWRRPHPRPPARAKSRDGDPRLSEVSVRRCPAGPIRTGIGASRERFAFRQAKHVGGHRPSRGHVDQTRHRPMNSTNSITADGREGKAAYYEASGKLSAKKMEKSGIHSMPATHPSPASWNDAEAYARWSSTGNGHRYGCQRIGWEYAARAGGEAVAEVGVGTDRGVGEREPGDASAAHRVSGVGRGRLR